MFSVFCQKLWEWRDHPACRRLAVVGQPVNHVFCHAFSPTEAWLERLQASGTTHPLTSAPTSMPNSPFLRKEMPQKISFHQGLNWLIQDNVLGHHPRHSHQASTKRSDGKCHLVKGYQVVMWIDSKIGWTGIGLNATSIPAIPGASFKKCQGSTRNVFFETFGGLCQVESITLC